MAKLRVVVALPNDNAYQHEQGVAAKAAAERLGLDLRILQAGDDAITQSQQLLDIIQSPSQPLPDALVVEPVTHTGLRRVAEAAVSAKIAWVISNTEVDYLQQLRKNPQIPVFSVSQKQQDIGRLMGKQLSALLPSGGNVLYIQGPSTSAVAVQRHDGMESARPSTLHLTALRSKWSEESSCQSVSSWLKLATSRPEKIDLVAGHTHELVLGARKAFLAIPDVQLRNKWLSLPFLGMGISSQVKPLVDGRILTAAVITSLTMPRILEMLVHAFETKTQPPDSTFVEAASYPPLEKLSALR
jgi:ABC-type sugar transport system substrate-binding protein